MIIRQEQTISRAYAKCKFNLTLTTEALEVTLPTYNNATWVASKTSTLNGMRTENIGLLQEIAYIEHKEKIAAYTARVKRIDDEEFKTLKVICPKILSLYLG